MTKGSSRAKAHKIKAPISDDDICLLHTGEHVALTGTIYTARDASHRRLMADITEGKSISTDLTGQVIYYSGPAPARPSRIIGSIGPTTSMRMDAYVPAMLELGVNAFIGKGRRSPETRIKLKEYSAVYLIAIGGVGAYLSRFIEAADVVAYPELGPEAIFRLKVKNMPLIVADDIYGDDLFERERARWMR